MVNFFTRTFSCGVSAKTVLQTSSISLSESEMIKAFLLDLLFRDKNILRGITSSKMIYFPDTSQWKIVDMDKKTLALTNGSSDFPLGSRRWHFVDGNCTDLGQPWRTLNLHQSIPQPGPAEITSSYLNLTNY